MKKATYIEIRWDDGSVDHAQGEAASKIWEWLDWCQVNNCIHGHQYSGPRLEHSPAPAKEAA